MSNPLVEEKINDKGHSKIKYSQNKPFGSCCCWCGCDVTSNAAMANDFSTISANIMSSIQDVPGLLSGLAYIMGVILGILGVLKIKDHVENPTQTPLKEGAIRLAVGGALFALPILFEAMFETIGNDQTGVVTATLDQADLGV